MLGMISPTSREHESTITTSSPHTKYCRGQSAAATMIVGGKGASTIPAGKATPWSRVRQKTRYSFVF